MESKLFITPDPEELDAGQIFVDVTFDGQARQCFLDTGAKSTKLLDDDHFSKYKALKSVELAGLADKAIQASRIYVSEVKIGAKTLGGHELVRLTSTAHVEPTLGIDIFQNQSFLFDFPNSRVSFMPLPQNSYHFKKSAAGYITLNAKIDSLKVHTIWDTGAGLTTFDQGLIDQNPRHFRFLKSLAVGDSLEKDNMKLNMYEVKDLIVDGLNFQRVKVLGADFQPIRDRLKDGSIQGALGFNVLAHYQWHFDMQNQQYIAR